MTDETDEEFETVTFKLNGVANGVAACDDIVLRQGPKSRLLFRAKLVDKPGTDDGVRGKLILQKKASKKTWDECDTIDLRRLKAGQGVAIEMKSADVAQLRQALHELQWLVDVYGIESDTRFVGVRENIFGFLNGKPPVEVIAARDGSEDEVAAAIEAVLRQANPSGIVEALKDADIDDLLQYRGQIGVSALDQLIDEWKQMPEDATELDWQRLLSRYSFALCQVFYAPTVVIEDEAYVGGKKVDNAGGSVVDFLLRNEITERAHLIEIKKPTSRLLQSAEYRNGVWGAGKELVGAVAQVMTYRDRFSDEVPEDANEDPVALRRCLPMCAVIVGDRAQLATKAQKRAFSNFRSRPDVIILTFDEVLERIEAVRNVLRNVVL